MILGNKPFRYELNHGSVAESNTERDAVYSNWVPLIGTRVGISKISYSYADRAAYLSGSADLDIAELFL